MKVIKHKFHAVRCESDGKKFPSKLERAYYNQLVLRQKAGDVLFFLRQVAFDLPGNVRYFADFEVFLPDGTVEFIDCKGMMTKISDMKIKQVEEIYPITIKIVRKA
jgi:hypothetical protein